MAASLSPTCTPLKTAYDSCFNAWFEGYLEPAVAAGSATPQERQAYSEKKAAEFQEKCGGIWESYRACVQQAVKEKGLETLLEQAREENPLLEPPSSSQFQDSPSSSSNSK